ncbi:MAG: HAMP domain-containing histidine kinase [Clostridiaceae bacterium]|nr:HAMP domain-containing histidine kinase [Clostridiaceae bacterium]
MSFFRNPEIKKSIIVYVVLVVLLSITGFVFSFDIGITVLFVSLFFMFVHFYATYKRYKRIAGLANEINRILHGKDILDLAEYSEGELSILHSELIKLTVQFREQAWALKQDKVYLADSLADISHQIRTPLTSINIITSLLSKPDLTDTRRNELFNELDILLGRIEWLITTLLKISKLDTGTIKLKKEKIMVCDLIKKAIEPIAISLELREQEIHTKILGDETLYGDFGWTVEAVENILKNCMENTQKGSIIRITALENVLYTEITITDNGPGIQKEDLPHLFERFYKGKNSSDQGFGIGLALARTIIVSQSGTIKAENAPEGGARFTIRFYKQFTETSPLLRDVN